MWFLRLESNPEPPETRPLPDGIKTVEWADCGQRWYGKWGKTGLYRDYKRLLGEIRPDLVHAGPVQTCGFMTALTGYRPFLLMSWGSDILVEPYQNGVNRLITKYTIDRADMIVCDCLTVRDKITRLASYNPEMISVFPWGVELDRFYPRESGAELRRKLGWEKNRVIISTRSLEPLYGIDTLLEAANKVIKKRADVRFLMVGDGSLRPYAQEFITRHNIGHAVSLAGRVDNDLLADYLSAADIYVSTAYSDGTSVSLLEAMACKLPVIVTDIQSNREWVQPGVNGWLAPPGDVDVLSQRIIQAVDRENIDGMGEKNLDIVRHRANWNDNSNILLDAYRWLTGRDIK